MLRSVVTCDLPWPCDCKTCSTPTGRNFHLAILRNNVRSCSDGRSGRMGGFASDFITDGHLSDVSIDDVLLEIEYDKHRGDF
ncbi:hypothetical protein KAR91_27375 [Candidatus Pacearchaeota archaeon]|nr:hypothetical protein [Candidatus Pacearchaeota archaeon]